MFDFVTSGLLFLFAIIGGLIARKLGQPVILGLLVIGMLVGPNMLNLIHDSATITLMREIGTILFLFVIGLEFSVKKLVRTGVTALLLSMIKTGILFLLGFSAMSVLGFDVLTAVFVGIIISFSSTTIALNVLRQRKLLKRPEVPVLVAVLVLENIVGVLALAFLSSGKSHGILVNMHVVFISLGVLILAYVLMSKFAERIVKWVMRNSGDESTVFISLGLCVGFAYLASVLGMSASIGAFLAGSVVNMFREKKSFERAVMPHTAMFTSLFFLSVGTSINVMSILAHLDVLVVLLAVIITGLALSMGVASRMIAGFDEDQARFGMVTMLPMSVFSLLLAQEGMRQGITLDLVSITSILILLLTMSMSVGITHFSRVPLVRRGVVVRNAVRVSQYVKNGLDELGNETTYTRRLKTHTTKIALFAIGSLFVLLSVARYASQTQGAIRALIICLGVVLSALIVYWSVPSWKASRELIVHIVAGVEGGTTKKKTKRALARFSRGFILVVAGLFSPLIVYAFSLPAVMVSVSFFIVGSGIIEFSRGARLLHHYHPEYKYSSRSYKKLSLSRT